MKFDISLNGKKYIVEIENSKAMIVEKSNTLEFQEDDIADNILVSVGASVKKDRGPISLKC